MPENVKSEARSYPAIGSSAVRAARIASESFAYVPIGSETTARVLTPRRVSGPFGVEVSIAGASGVSAGGRVSVRAHTLIASISSAEVGASGMVVVRAVVGTVSSATASPRASRRVFGVVEGQSSLASTSSGMRKVSALCSGASSASASATVGGSFTSWGQTDIVFGGTAMDTPFSGLP